MKAHHKNPVSFGFGSGCPRDKIEKREQKSSGTYANIQAENDKIAFLMTMGKKKTEET